MKTQSFGLHEKKHPCIILCLKYNALIFRYDHTHTHAHMYVRIHMYTFIHALTNELSTAVYKRCIIRWNRPMTSMSSVELFIYNCGQLKTHTYTLENHKLYVKERERETV